jgi:hypothetical protein
MNVWTVKYEIDFMKMMFLQQKKRYVFCNFYSDDLLVITEPSSFLLFFEKIEK